MTSFFVKTLGCKVNAYDSNTLETRFRALGWSEATTPDDCDVWVLNTCTVTQAADRDVRNFIRNIRTKNPKVLLVVAGCFVQANPEQAAELGGVDLIVGNDQKPDLVELILKRMGVSKASAEDNGYPGSATLGTRAVLKIQDGCNGQCSYCIVPRARGQSRSAPSRIVLDEARRLLANDCKEIVLTGIHVGMYGADFGHGPQGSGSSSEPTSFVEFLRLLTALPEWHRNNARLRLSSIEPNELTPELLEALANSPARICDHFHLPLQAGSDAVLKRMNRTYTRELYADRVAAIRRLFPRANIGADVITGFPGETEQDFADTLHLVESCGLSGLHVFPYSRRPGTPAADMPQQVPDRIITQRAERLRTWSKEAHFAFARSFVGASLEVLWESTINKAGHRTGHAGNYLAVRSPDGGLVQWNAFSSVTIRSVNDDGTLAGATAENP